MENFLNYITWTASPEIFSGFISVRWYGLMFAVGFWIGYDIVARMFKHEGACEAWLSSILLWSVVATIVGSRLGHVFFYDWEYYSHHLDEIPMVWKGGLASHGGTIGNIIAVILVAKYVCKKSPLWLFDRFVIPIALVGAMIRFGNLMNSEIFGGVTTLPWGFEFVNSYEWQRDFAPHAVHPTQIYESLCYLTLFAALMWMYWKKNLQSRPGLIFGTFLIGIFASRFFIEYVKNVQEPWEIQLREACGMDMGQILSIPFILIGIYFAVRALRKPPVALSFPEKFSDAK